MFHRRNMANSSHLLFECDCDEMAHCPSTLDDFEEAEVNGVSKNDSRSASSQNPEKIRNDLPYNLKPLSNCEKYSEYCPSFVQVLSYRSIS